MNHMQNLMDEALDLEVVSAAAPPSIETTERLAGLLGQMGLAEVRLAVIQAAGCQTVDRAEYGRVRLAALIEQKALGKLEEAVIAIRRETPRPNRLLRRLLADAHCTLKQIGVAADQWIQLLADMNSDDWPALARFVARHSGGAPLFAAIRNQAGEFPDDAGSAYARYCLIRSLLDERPGQARSALRVSVDPDALADAEVLLDLAITAFRLGEYDCARRAAEKSLAAGGPRDIGESVINSVRSFAGGDDHLSRRLSLPFGVADLVRAQAGAVGGRNFMWGYVMGRAGGLSVSTLPWGPVEVRNMLLPEGRRIIASFSVLPAQGIADPYEILPFVDWTYPHILLRRQPAPRMHLFVGLPGEHEWAWSEVRLGMSRPKGSAKQDEAPDLWQRVRDELHLLEVEE